jgi:hypothetical protein
MHTKHIYEFQVDSSNNSKPFSEDRLLLLRCATTEGGALVQFYYGSTESCCALWQFFTSLTKFQVQWRNRQASFTNTGFFYQF